MQETYEVKTDDELLCKLVFKCIEAGDLSAARRFSTIIQKPEFAQCRYCLAPLLPGITSKASSRPKRRLVLSCQSCSSPSGAELVLEPASKEERNSRKRRRVETTNIEPVSAMTPSASQKQPSIRNKNATEQSHSKPVSTEKIRDIQVRQVKNEVSKPLTLLELAEQRKKEEKKRRKSEGHVASSTTSQDQIMIGATTAAAPAPPAKSSLGNIAKLLHS